ILGFAVNLIELNEGQCVFCESAVHAKGRWRPGTLKIVHAIGFENGLANSARNWSGHDADFFSVEPRTVLGGRSSAAPCAAGFTHIKDLCAVRIEPHDVGIFVAVYKKFRRSGSEPLPENVEFTLPVGNVENSRAVGRPFIGPADTFVEGQPLYLTERLGLRLYLGQIDGWR